MLVCAVLASVYGQDVTIGSGAYPRFARLSNGVLLCAVDGVNGTDRVIQIYASSESASTVWRPFSEVTRRPASGFDLANPHLAVLAAPEQLLVAFRVRNVATQESWLDVCTSKDGGRSWTWLSQIAHSTTRDAHQYEPFLHVLGPKGDHEVLVLFASEVTPQGQSIMPDQMILARRSLDRGLTWGPYITVCGREAGRRPGMPALVDIGAGQFVVFYEMSDRGKFSIYSVRSSDAGNSWVLRHTLLSSQAAYNGSPWATLVFPSAQPQPFIRAVWMTDSRPPLAINNNTNNNNTTSLAVGPAAPQLFACDLVANWSIAIRTQPHATGLFGYWPSVFQSRQGQPLMTARSDGPVKAFFERV